MQLPDALIQVDGTAENRVVFEPGTVSLEPDQVGTYLSWRNPDEQPLNRVVRQEDFWRSWVDTVAGVGNLDVGSG